MSENTAPTDPTRSPDEPLDRATLDEDAAARGAIYALLSSYLDEPDAEQYAAIESGRLTETVAALLDRTTLAVEAPTLSTDDDHDTLCARYNDMFALGHAEYTDRTDGSLDSQGPPVPLHESSYRPDVSWNDVNLDLARAYDYFGLGIDEQKRRHHDHIRLELSFAAYLCRREAAVDPEVAAARLDLHDRHLRPFVTGLVDRMADQPAPDVYGPLVAFLDAFTAADVADLAGGDGP